MDATAHRFVIVALLTVVVLMLGVIWMSITSYSYAKLHLFIFAPSAFLYFIPPRPLSNVNPGIRQFGYSIMLVLGVVAVVYSVTGWDRILYQNGVITCSNSYGSLFFVPYEEWFWCIDHTMLVCLWVMSIWSSRPVPQTRGSAYVGFRIVSAVALLSMAYFGYLLQGYGKNTFYLGLTLLHTFPIFALHFAAIGHIYLQYPRECILGLLVPSVYVLGVDTFAINRGIWAVTDEFTTETYVFGVMIEHIVIYTLTTSLASQSMVGFLRCAEIYQAVQKRESKEHPTTIKSLVHAITSIWR